MANPYASWEKNARWTNPYAGDTGNTTILQGPRMTRRTLQLSTYRLVKRAVIEGLRLELRQTWKHRDDAPDDATYEALVEQGCRGVMLALEEILDFSEDS